jgi:hypothetical protein
VDTNVETPIDWTNIASRRHDPRAIASARGPLMPSSGESASCSVAAQAPIRHHAAAPRSADAPYFTTRHRHGHHPMPTETKTAGKTSLLQKAAWIILLISLLLLSIVPILNMLAHGLISLDMGVPAPLSPERLGQLGDFFGGHTAAFTGLTSTALILYFSRKQLEDQEKQFREQLRVARQSADLTSLSAIYQHYDEAYGSGRDKDKILEHLAEGHRRWVIRESFSIIDPDSALEEHRIEQVRKDHTELQQLLTSEEMSIENFRKIAALVASLLLDKRLNAEQRKALWGYYELIRASPESLTVEGSEARQEFETLTGRQSVQPVPAVAGE